MAPACGGGPSNWNCLLETMEPILPLPSLRIPFSSSMTKVPSALQDLLTMVMFGEEVAEEAAEEVEEDGAKVDVVEVDTRDLETTDLESMDWTAIPKVDVKLTAAPEKVAFGAKVEKLSPGVKNLVVVGLVSVVVGEVVAAEAAEAIANSEILLNCIVYLCCYLNNKCGGMGFSIVGCCCFFSECTVLIVWWGFYILFAVIQI